MYIAAYLEDQISELGLWQSFTAEHKRLYGKYLPFYPTNSNYVADEINEEDIRLSFGIHGRKQLLCTKRHI